MGAVLVDLGASPQAGALVVVPAQNPAPPPGQGEEFGKASPVALVVIILLALATIVLIRSMTGRIKRLPASFDPPADAPADEAGERPGPDGAAGGEPAAGGRAGGDPAAGDATGSDTTGSDTTGSDTTGSDTTGSDTTGRKPRG